MFVVRVRIAWAVEMYLTSQTRKLLREIEFCSQSCKSTNKQQSVSGEMCISHEGSIHLLFSKSIFSLKFSQQIIRIILIYLSL